MKYDSILYQEIRILEKVHCCIILRSCTEIHNMKNLHCCPLCSYELRSTPGKYALLSILYAWRSISTETQIAELRSLCMEIHNLTLSLCTDILNLEKVHWCICFAIMHRDPQPGIRELTVYFVLIRGNPRHGKRTLLLVSL